MCGNKTSRFSSWIFDELPEATESIGIAYFFFDGRDSPNELQLHNKQLQAYPNHHFTALTLDTAV